MAASLSLLVLSFSSFVLAIPKLEARQIIEPSSCPTPQIEGYACFSLAPSSYASSLCGSYPPVDTAYVTTNPTTTTTMTAFIATDYVPTATVTVTSLIVQNSTLTTSDLFNITTGTQTSYGSTTTTLITETSTQYTCSGSSSALSASTSAPAVLTKRQGVSASPGPTDAASSCISSYTVAKGTDGLRLACACEFTTTSTSTTTKTIPGGSTITSTTVVQDTLTTSGVLTSTDLETTQATVTSTEFITQTVAPSATGVLTITRTSTTVVTSPSPLPSDFQLVVNFTDGTKAYASSVKISTGTELAFTNGTTSGDSFSINNATNTLQNSNLSLAVAAEAKLNAVPYVYFLAEPQVGSSGAFLLQFSACDGVLTGSWISGGSTFLTELCNVNGEQVLAIGPPTAFEGSGVSGCQHVTVGIVGGSISTFGGGGGGSGNSTTMVKKFRPGSGSWTVGKRNGMGKGRRMI